MKIILLILLSWFVVACSGSSNEPVASTSPAEADARLVTGTRIINADQEPGNWLSTGRTYDEQRFSPLTKINDGNVSNLGLVWYFDIDTNRAMEATPLKRGPASGGKWVVAALPGTRLPMTPT